MSLDTRDVYEAARGKGVSFSMHYSESDDTFYFIVSSVAPSENFIGKNKSFENAKSDVLDHLAGL